jgi:hypothetical protein
MKYTDLERAEVIVCKKGKVLTLALLVERKFPCLAIKLCDFSRDVNLGSKNRVSLIVWHKKRSILSIK